MRKATQYDCMDNGCRTVLIMTEKDAVKCPRCEGPVFMKPFKPTYYEPTERALYVRRQIIKGDMKHCRSLTPEQVDTILSIGDAYVKEGENYRETTKSFRGTRA